MAEEVEILEEDRRTYSEQPEPGVGGGQQSNTDISGRSGDVSDELRTRVEDVTLSIYTARAGEIFGNGEYTIDHAFAEAAALLTRSANDQYLVARFIEAAEKAELPSVL
ncbi:hypothetical protein [Brucella pseudogrignonensis]|uniref:Uncharacterized protein n=1 Tax=Brucella pseudogrignonensis TaxID=419475 RepID=A0ABU1MEZ0_9HYPH|nr:hypothetical protein [Brucella pseudogrignonensis]MDR6434623.1 hypothetical protein [Brucella pseudogrignonensis]